MLKKLTVSNFAIIESAEVEFSPGLTVITGETGAGKSVLMGALDFVLGNRADASVVRDGAKEAEVEAEFEDKTIRRTVTAQGRSRAWMDDESVTIAELKEYGRAHMDVHGPTANQRLVETDFQRETLDAFGKVDAHDYSHAWSHFQTLIAERATLMEIGGDDELDLLRFQVSELEGAALSEEDATLSERHAAAAHSEEIIENANAVTEALGGDRSAAEILIALQPRFRALARHMPAAEGWATEAEDVTCRIQELSRSMADAVSKMERSEEDLATLDQRLTLVNRLLRKYHVAHVSDLLSLLAAKKEKMDSFEHREERLAKLEDQIVSAEKVVRAAGAALTKMRTAAADRLSKKVTKELCDLGFLQAKFFVACEPIEPTATGLDHIVYMFAPNPGESARPLADSASSGEIARVMLALKVATSQVRSLVMPTLVFDELDANIGGEVGTIVGEKLRTVARAHQVIAITHLPQSAVSGERHLVVSKATVSGRTTTRVVAVDGEERISEVARMLGGETLTSVTRKHAEELLQLSR